MATDEVVAVIGGTGKLGAAIARGLAQAGRQVLPMNAWQQRQGSLSSPFHFHRRKKHCTLFGRMSWVRSLSIRPCRSVSRR